MCLERRSRRRRKKSLFEMALICKK